MTTQERLEHIIHYNGTVGLGEQVKLALFLSLPAIFAQLSNILMSYIDASMVGSLGAQASASIGLVSTSIWMFGGISGSVGSGFSVQVAHLFGASRKDEANDVLRQAYVAAGIFGLVLLIIGVSICNYLPHWLGGNKDIAHDASLYFMIYSLAMPITMLYHLSVSMLRCSGNMKTPSIMSIVICILDVVFNFFFIFPTREISFFGEKVLCPGLGLGVLGAALGTYCAWTIGLITLLYYLCKKSKELRLTFKGRFLPEAKVIKKAIKIGMPMGLERIVSCGAHITSTMIVAPIGTIAIASNSFGITIESLCYMPGYGIADAATTLIGQSLGAKRDDLIKRFSYITLAIAVGVMSLLAIVMYIFSPELMTLMSPDIAVQNLTSNVLRIEAFAEPLYATSIICYGIFIGMADSTIPSIIQWGTIWAIRIPISIILAGQYGLVGVWIAMAFELCARGIIMLVRLIRKLVKLNQLAQLDQ